jgi:hypothetical protein
MLLPSDSLVKSHFTLSIFAAVYSSSQQSLAFNLATKILPPYLTGIYLSIRLMAHCRLFETTAAAVEVPVS